MRNLWEKLKADIKRAPMWVWVGLGLTLLLVYFAWQNWAGGSGSTTSDLTAPPLPTDSGGGGSSTTGGTTGSTLPTMPGLPTSSSGQPFIPAPPDTSWLQTPSIANTSSAASAPVRAGLSAFQQAVLHGTRGGPVGLHVSPSGPAYGPGMWTPINNPTMASQLAHRGRPVPSGIGQNIFSQNAAASGRPVLHM